jgi:hypothetical protein
LKPGPEAGCLHSPQLKQINARYSLGIRTHAVSGNFISLKQCGEVAAFLGQHDDRHGLIDLQQTPVDGVNIAPYKFFGCRGSGISWLSNRASVLPHHKLRGKKADFWDLGSAAPWQFSVVTEIVNYVCWLGGKFIDSNDRRALFVSGINRMLESLNMDGAVRVSPLHCNCAADIDKFLQETMEMCETF